MALRILILAVIMIARMAAPAVSSDTRLLVVLSEAGAVTLKSGKQHETGYFLSELMVPISEIARLGYEIVIATPNGKAPTMDRSSNVATYFKDDAEYRRLSTLHDSLGSLRAPLSLATMDHQQLNSYDGVFFPGGHAPLEDLVKNAHVSKILRYFHEHNRPTALICHGPAALLSSREEGKPWIYKGYKMTGFSTAEEKVAESGALKGEVPFYLDRELGQTGGLVTVRSPWKPLAVRHRELITGQNPQSDRALTQQLLIALAEVILRRATTVVPYPKAPNSFKPGHVYQIIPFPSDWRTGITVVYVGVRISSVDKARFQKALGTHLENARRVFGPTGLRGYLSLSSGDGEIAFMNWSSEAQLAAANRADGSETIAKESSGILETLAFEKHPDPALLQHPALP